MATDKNLASFEFCLVEHNTTKYGIILLLLLLLATSLQSLLALIESLP